MRNIGYSSLIYISTFSFNVETIRKNTTGGVRLQFSQSTKKVEFAFPVFWLSMYIV